MTSRKTKEKEIRMGSFRRNKRSRRRIQVEAKHIKIIAIVLCVAIVLSGGFLGIRKYQTYQLAKKQEEERLLKLDEIFDLAKQVTTDESKLQIPNTSVSITSIGNILCEAPMIQGTYDKETESYDFASVLKNSKPYITGSDLVVGSLETNFTEGDYSGIRRYNAPKELAEALKNIGVSILHTANNHSFDYGVKGAEDTKAYLKELGIEAVGTKSETEETSYVIQKRRNITFAFLSYTYGINEQDPNQEAQHVINFANKEKIAEDMEKVKAEGAECIVVNVHWGEVSSPNVTEDQKALADYLVDSGAMIILGTHPAFVQPMEVKKNKDGENVFIAYSTGNFLSANEYLQGSNDSDTGYVDSNMELILNIRIRKESQTGKVELSKINYTPIYLMDYGAKQTKNRYQLLDIKQEIEKYRNGEKNMDQKTYDKLIKALASIERLTTKQE